MTEQQTSLVEKGQMIALQENISHSVCQHKAYTYSIFPYIPT